MRAARSKLLSVTISTLLLLLLSSCLSLPSANRASSWDGTVVKIGGILNKAVEDYEKGDGQRAQQLAKDAYFDAFESSGMETAIRLSISSKRAFQVEYGFTEVNRSIRSGASASQVRQAVNDVMGMILEDAERLEASNEGGATGSFLASLFIIVREGFEAILIIGAIIAYLVRSGNRNKLGVMYRSAVLAILASIATAVAVAYLFNISGASQERLEGATMLLAMAVLVSVSFWLIGQAQARRWQRYIQGKIQASVTKGNSFALGSAVFLAVYREGAEIVLFYQALLSGSKGSEIGLIGLGFGVGVLVLAAIFIAIRFGSLKVPVKPFFMGTGILLFYMAFVFAGKGIRELQEAGTVGTSLIPGLSAIETLGVYPTWEGVGLQSLLLAIAGAGLVFQMLRSRASFPQPNASP